MNRVNCNWVTDKLATPTWKNLLEHEREALTDHLTTCAPCREREELATLLEEVAPRVAPSAPSPFVDRRIIDNALEGRLPKAATAPTSHTWTLAAAAALVTIALGGWLLFAPAGEQPEPVKPATPQVAATAPIPDAITTSERDTTGSTPKAAVTQPAVFADGMVVRTRHRDQVFGEAGTRFRLTNDQAPLTRIELLSGKIVVEAAKRQGGQKLIVATERTAVTVTGTVFSVTAAKDGDVVRVSEGEVQVTDLESGRTVTLGARKEFQQMADKPLPAAREKLAADQRLIGRRAQKTLPVSSTNEDAATLAGQAIKDQRLEEAVEHIGDARNSSQAKAVPDLLGRLARAYRQQKKYAMARQTYLQLIAEYQGTNAAQNALIALGQLELTVLGKKEEALGRFNQYLTNSPGGYLAEEATMGRVRSLAALGRAKETRATATTYLNSSGARAFEAEMLLHRANALANSGNCAGAWHDYNAILAKWPGSKIAARAQRDSAQCASR